MTYLLRRIPKGLFIAIIAVTVLAVMAAAQQMPRTTTERVAGTSSVKTEQLRGTVVYVEGNTLVVRMSNGEVKEFQPPADRKFVIDGKELTVGDLKPGTKLTATVTTTTTPVTERTTTVGTGKVFFVAPPTVILTLPNNENRMYKVDKNYRFNIGGQKASVFELRKGMVVSAEKIVETPKSEIASNVAVTGSAPPAPKPEVAQVERRPAPAPTPEARPEPTAAPAPMEQAAAPPAKKLPPTGSPVPLIGAIGMLLTGAGLALQRFRR